MSNNKSWKNMIKSPSQTDPLLREHAFNVRDPVIKDPCVCLRGLCGSFVLLFILIIMLFTCWYVSISSIYHEEFLFTLDYTNKPLYTTSKKFVSFGLDTSLLGQNFGNLNLSDEFLIKFIGHLAPGHLRFGGTMSDRLLFVENGINTNVYDKNKFKNFHDGGTCSYEHKNCKQPDDLLILTGNDWLKLARFANKSGLSLLFDLNVLLRENDTWISNNAKQIIQFSDDNQLDVDWQLGNEPNSFRHVFGTPVSAKQLAQDYETLKVLLSNYSRYSTSFITGPETTRPLTETSDSVEYMKEFLIEGKENINVLSWHQYYMNGREAVLDNFLDPNIFNLLYNQILIVKSTLLRYGSPNMPIWISETGSAYGGGAPGLSDTFAGSFIYLDKLGLSAQLGINVVIRQSLYGAHYTMISEQFQPLPDWWVAVLYKTFVGERVLHSHSHSNGPIRLYAHCTSVNARLTNNSAVTVYGVNLKSSDQVVRFNGALYKNMPRTILAYYLTPYKGNLQAIKVSLNGVPLKLTKDGNLPPFKPVILDTRHTIYIPKHSIVFFVFHGLDFPACN